jgi:hypothetical protein
MPDQKHFQALRDDYLKREFPEEYSQMKKSGALKPHLSQVGAEAMDLWETVASQMHNSPDLPTDYAARVQALEAIPEQVRDLINHDLIWQPLPQKPAT